MNESKNGRDFIGKIEATKNGRIINRKFEKDLKFIYKIPNEVQREYQDPIDAYEEVFNRLLNDISTELFNNCITAIAVNCHFNRIQKIKAENAHN